MYSDISNRNSSTPIISDSCLETSVFPTPVGPEKRNDPIGFSSGLRPALDNLIAEANMSIASS